MYTCVIYIVCVLRLSDFELITYRHPYLQYSRQNNNIYVQRIVSSKGISQRTQQSIIINVVFFTDCNLHLLLLLLLLLPIYLFIFLICASVCLIRIQVISQIRYPTPTKKQSDFRLRWTMITRIITHTYLYFSCLFVLCHPIYIELRCITCDRTIVSCGRTRLARSRFVYELLYTIQVVGLSNGIFVCIWIICIYYVGILV